MAVHRTRLFSGLWRSVSFLSPIPASGKVSSGSCQIPKLTTARQSARPSGEIRLRELRDYGKANSGDIDGVLLADFIQQAGTDGDRRINLAEFKSFFA
jgi:hypothetical protein